MSLFLALGIAAAVSIFLRFRYGPQVIPYAAAALLLILFLYCPAEYYPGIGMPVGAGLAAKVDRLGDVVSFGLLIVAVWIAEGQIRKRST